MHGRWKQGRLLGGNTKTWPVYAIVEFRKPKLSRVKTSKEGEAQKEKFQEKRSSKRKAKEGSEPLLSGKGDPVHKFRTHKGQEGDGTYPA